MPYWVPYISAYTSTTKEPRRVVTRPLMMEGMAAGNTMRTIRLRPRISSVSALSR